MQAEEQLIQVQICPPAGAPIPEIIWPRTWLGPRELGLLFGEESEVGRWSKW
jgi:hypothetical protein